MNVLSLFTHPIVIQYEQLSLCVFGVFSCWELGSLTAVITMNCHYMPRAMCFHAWKKITAYGFGLT